MGNSNLKPWVQDDFTILNHHHSRIDNNLAVSGVVPFGMGVRGTPSLKSWPTPSTEKAIFFQYDWATQATEGLAPDVDQLNGAVDASMWADVSDIGGSQALASFAAQGDALSQRIVLTPTDNSTDAQGIYLAAVSGNFVYAGRVGVSREMTVLTTNAYYEVHMGFAAHDTVTGSVYMGGIVPTTTGYAGSAYYWHMSNTAWNSAQGADNPLDGGQNFALFDIVLERTGDTLNIYGGRAGEPILFSQQYTTVDTGAGSIFIRFRSNVGADADQFRIYLYAFARVASVDSIRVTG